MKRAVRVTAFAHPDHETRHRRYTRNEPSRGRRNANKRKIHAGPKEGHHQQRKENNLEVPKARQHNLNNDQSAKIDGISEVIEMSAQKKEDRQRHGHADHDLYGSRDILE